MQRRRHVEAFSVVVGAAKSHVLGGSVGADALKESAQVHARPLADVVPSLHADVLDDHFLLGQLVKLFHGPRPLVLDETGESELPACTIDRLYVFDVEMGIEARRLDDLRFRIGRRQVIRPEDEGLDSIVPIGNSAQHSLQLCVFGHGAGAQLCVFGQVAAAKQREAAKRQTAAQDVASVNLCNELAVLIKKGLTDALARMEHRFQKRLHGVLAMSRSSYPGAGWCRSSTGPPVNMATNVCGTRRVSKT